MLVDEGTKDLDNLGAMLETLDDGKHITERFGKAFHGSFGGIEGGVELTKSVGDLFQKKNNLDTNDGGDDGED